MTKAQVLASFVERARFADLSVAAAEQLKIRVLDTIGGALGALTLAPLAPFASLQSSSVAALYRPSSAAAGPRRTGRPSSMARSADISISWTVISQKARPVFPPAKRLRIQRRLR